jgi:pilus assembly protein CpaE
MLMGVTMAEQEKIRVLIVDDIAETRENIRRLLQFDPTIEVAGSARSGQEGIDLAQQLKPDVVIMDINMPDLDGITATERIRKKVPYIQVVILSVQTDANYMRRAMLAGARDFLTKPPSIDELNGAIRRAGQMAKEERKKLSQSYSGAIGEGGQSSASSSKHFGKVIVVYSPKGGTGCTTITTNLAVALHDDAAPCLIIDGSVQYGDVAVFLNEQVKNSVLDLTPRVEELDQEVIESVTIYHAASGLRIVAAPPRPEMADTVSGEEFGKLLKVLSQYYAYVVVDTTSYLTEVVQAALENADLIVLITTQDIPAIKNANAFLTLADASGIHRNRIAFIMNRYDKRIQISPERVGESLRQPIVAALPLDERLVSSSVNRGIPFLLDNKTQPISKGMLLLADILKGMLIQEVDEPELVKK